MSKHVVIPDAHAKPDTDNERFDILGEFILSQRPDTVICLGDFADMEALSSYDRGKKSFEGRRYNRDVASVRDALDRLHRAINVHNDQQRRNKKKLYEPRLIMCLGNHEVRIDRATNMEPMLDGTISIDDLGYKEYGWEVHPFLEAVNVDGIYYSHYFVSGVLGNPIGGVTPAKSIIAKHMVSCTGGHSHVYDMAVATSPNGRRINGLVAGCYFEYPMEFAHATQHLWVPSVTVKHDVQDGEYDIERWSMKRLRER